MVIIIFKSHFCNINNIYAYKLVFFYLRNIKYSNINILYQYILKKEIVITMAEYAQSAHLAIEAGFDVRLS